MENNTNIDSIASNTSPPAIQEISLREIHALYSQVKPKCYTRQWQTVMQLTIHPTIFGNKVWLLLFVMHHIVQEMYSQQSTKVFKVVARESKGSEKNGEWYYICSRIFTLPSDKIRSMSHSYFRQLVNELIRTFSSKQMIVMLNWILSMIIHHMMFDIMMKYAEIVVLEMKIEQ